MKTQVIYVTAKLGIAEYLSGGPKSSGDLAKIFGTDSAALYRLLRAAESMGFFTEPEPGIFALTSLGEYLKKDSRGGFYNQILMNVELFYDLWGEVIHTIKTGRSADQKVYGMTFFEYIQLHPEKAELFNEEMTNFISTMAPAVVANYDFSSFKQIVDIGGGHGTLMEAILQANPQTAGVIFDIPVTVKGARQQFDKIGLSNRCKFVRGDFFESVPTGDCMILSAIISDWNDEQSVRILSNCRHVIKPYGRLLLLERLVIPEEPAPSTALLDLAMLVTGGGTGRSKKEYQKLLADSGFELIRVIPTGAQRSIFEAKPV